MTTQERAKQEIESQSKSLWNFVGTSNTVKWPLTWPAQDDKRHPKIGEVVSEYFTGTAEEALTRFYELVEEHASADFIAHEML